MLVYNKVNQYIINELLFNTQGMDIKVNTAILNIPVQAVSSIVFL